MGRSPLRILFTLTFICAIIGGLVSYLHSRVDWYGIRRFPPIQELKLAHFYWTTGQTEKAINEYSLVIQGKIPGVSDQASQELNKLISYEGDSFGKLISNVLYTSWILPPNLYALSALFFLLFLIVFIAGRITQRPLFVIMPVSDISHTNLGENLPQLATDRLREVVWRMRTLENTTSLISENLELPVMGMISDSSTMDSVALIETALMFSGGASGLPLSRLINSLKLWLEQPKFLIRGNIRKWGNTLCLQVLLFEKKGEIQKTWKIEVKDDNISDTISELVDGLIYPLLFQFSQNINTRKWEALKALHDALQEFQLYREHEYDPICLNRAKEYMKRALIIDPNYNPAKNNLGLLLLYSGDYDGAREMFKDISVSSTNKRDRLFALYNYGVSLFHIGQDWAYKLASETFKNILDDCNGEQSEFVNLVKSTLAITHARIAIRSGKNNERHTDLAVQLAEKVLESHKTTKETQAYALSAIGFVYMAKKEFDKAVASFSDAVQKNPENVSCLIGLGDVYFQSHQIDQAITTFRKAEMLSHSSGYSSFRLGNIYREMGDLEQARAAYLRASNFALAHVALGKMYILEQEFSNALDEFRIAVKQNSHLSDAWVNIAWVICELNTGEELLLKEAESSARRALQLEKNQDQLWHRRAVLARVLLLRGKKEISLQEALKAVELGPDRAQAHYYLAETEYSLGQYSKARNSLKKVMGLNGDTWHRAAEELLDRIGGSE